MRRLLLLPMKLPLVSARLGSILRQKPAENRLRSQYAKLSSS